jgi:hypothetical protein
MVGPLDLARRHATLTLEHVLTSEAWFGLQATPVQRMVCRLADGLLEALPQNDPTVSGDYPQDIIERSRMRDMFGPIDVAQDRKPLEFWLIAGIRTFKSLLAAAKAVHASQTCDLSALRVGEVARFAIQSLSIDNAKAIYEHLYGAWLTSPIVRELVAVEPKPDSGVMYLRTPSGHVVEVLVLAGKRAGGSLVSRWLIGGVFDEASRMIGKGEGVINLDEARHAALERLTPGAQLWYVSSPYGPIGPLYQAFRDFYGKAPGETAIVRCPGAALNPFHWTAEKSWSLKRRPRSKQIYLTDCLAEFADLETQWFEEADLLKAQRVEHQQLPPVEGVFYVATFDPATRVNAWTVCIAGLYPDGVRRVVFLRQWQGTPGAPLKARPIFKEMKPIFDAYRIMSCFTDQWAADLVVEIGGEEGLFITVEHVTGPMKFDRFTTLVSLMAVDQVELPPGTAEGQRESGGDDRTPGEMALDDLRRTRRRLTQDGVQVVFEKTADGRHCDYAPVIAGSILRASMQPEDVLHATPTEGQRQMEDARQRARGVVAGEEDVLDFFVDGMDEGEDSEWL